MVYCDRNDDIIYWASEELAIPYFSPIDKKVHRYFPDFIIKTKQGKRFMIEIKPAKYLKPPKPGKERQNDSLVNKLNLFVINLNEAC